MEPIVERLLGALGASLDAKKLESELARLVPSPRGSSVPAPEFAPGPSGAHAAHPVLAKLVIDDLLDDSIREAGRDDRSFPLRVLLGELSASLATSDAAFGFGAALGTFFRSTQADEAKMYLGLETSEQFYRFAKEGSLEPALVAKSAPLLASLLSTELERLRFESVDNVHTFDSSLCERATGSNNTESRISRPLSFLCRITATQAVRAKAKVLT